MRACLLGFALVALLATSSVCAAESAQPGEERLRAAYQTNMAGLMNNSFGLPLVLESFAKDDKVYVDVYGIFTAPFDSVVTALEVPANWCDIVTLHPNVKACTQQELTGTWLLTLYFGRKFYQPADDARQVAYRYRNLAQQQGYLDILLSADSGPFGTRDHKLSFAALPVDGDRTFVHVSYAYHDTFALRLAAISYFATLGRGKVGFTVTATDRNNQPVYIDGARGAIERNAVRYYLAIQAFMSTRHFPAGDRFSKSINAWYDLTLPYHPQLFDLDRQDYLTFKAAEHNNRLVLQHTLETSLP
jgi:hypothetical protein